MWIEHMDLWRQWLPLHCCTEVRRTSSQLKYVLEVICRNTQCVCYFQKKYQLYLHLIFSSVQLSAK